MHWHDFSYQLSIVSALASVHEFSLPIEQKCFFPATCIDFHLAWPRENERARIAIDTFDCLPTSFWQWGGEKKAGQAWQCM